MNFAAIYYSCRLSSSSTTTTGPSRSRSPLQTATATLAQKAVAAGMPGEQVDGNDVIAVRAGTGPRTRSPRRVPQRSHTDEALTYRLGDRTTADDARRYRSDEEVKAHWQQEPIGRLKKYLVSQGVWVKADEEGLVSDVTAPSRCGRRTVPARKPPAPAAMFDHLYAELPSRATAATEPASERLTASEMTLVEAVNTALRGAPWPTTSNVVVLGEDVGVNGGMFRANRRPSGALWADRADRRAGH